MLGVMAALLIAVGAVVMVTAPAQNFGWFAYAPLSDSVYSPPRCSLPEVLGGRQWLGLVAVIAGLVLAGVAVGLRLGQRHIR